MQTGEASRRPYIKWVFCCPTRSLNFPILDLVWYIWVGCVVLVNGRPRRVCPYKIPVIVRDGLCAVPFISEINDHAADS